MFKENHFEKKELKPAKIELHFFRHSIKESNDVTLPNDDVVKLSQEGKDLAKENAFDNVNLDQAIAFGSPRIRTQETAILRMVGKNDTITGTESLEELKDIVNQDLKVGSKVGVDDRLNFTDSNETPVGRAVNDAYSRGEYLKYTVENSDKLAHETNDASGANYSHKAAQVAQILLKYVQVLPRWEELVSDPQKKYTDTLERYMGTHASISESFLAKLLEKTEGKESRDAFVEKYPNGFTYLKGFDASIETDQHGVLSVKISFELDGTKKEKVISEELIKEIISEDK
jgi:hypothetical protein